jgi:hypothetical protein
MEMPGFTWILGRSSDQTTYLLAVTALAGFVLWLITRLVQRAFRSLPPGPKGLPLIGDVVHIQDPDWLTSPQRVAEYGDTLRLQCLWERVHVPFIRRNDVYKCAWEWRPYPQ